jgi:hypothetical protein
MNEGVINHLVRPGSRLKTLFWQNECAPVSFDYGFFSVYNAEIVENRAWHGARMENGLREVKLMADGTGQVSCFQVLSHGQITSCRDGDHGPKR